MGKSSKRFQSTGKIIYEQEKIVVSPDKGSVKIVLNKSNQLKEK